MKTLRGFVGVAAIGALACVPAQASAGSLTLSGKLSGSGLTGARVVIVGEAAGAPSTTVRNGKFTLRLPTSFAKARASVQVLSSGGAYLGPIVLRKGRKSGRSVGYLRLSSKAKGSQSLGTVKFRKGAGTPSKPLAAKYTDSRAVSLNSTGAPKGAGNLGLVLTAKGARAAQGATDQSKPGADPDSDGVVNAMDVDVNGNGILNPQDAQTVAAGKAAGQQPFVFASLFVPFAKAAGGASNYTENVREYLTVNFGLPATSVQAPSAVQVDCQGVPWCAKATVKTAAYGFPAGSPWPTDAATGRQVVGRPPAGAGFDIGLLPNVTPAEIAAGQNFQFVITGSDGEKTVPLGLTPYFQAPPSPTSIAGNVIGPNPAEGTTSPGSSPIAVNSTIVPIVVNRPVRPAVPGAEAGRAVSMGKLGYGVYASTMGSSSPPANCPAAAFSDFTPTLSVAAAGSSFGLADSGDDSPETTGRTIGFSVDLSKCADRSGRSPAPGETVMIDVYAQDAAGNQAITQGIRLKL